MKCVNFLNFRFHEVGDGVANTEHADLGPLPDACGRQRGVLLSSLSYNPDVVSSVLRPVIGQL